MLESEEQKFELARQAQRALRDRIRTRWPDVALGGIGIGDENGAWVLRVNVTGGNADSIPARFRGFPVEVDLVGKPTLRGTKG